MTQKVLKIRGKEIHYMKVTKYQLMAPILISPTVLGSGDITMETASVPKFQWHPPCIFGHFYFLFVVFILQIESTLVNCLQVASKVVPSVENSLGNMHSKFW